MGDIDTSMEPVVTVLMPVYNGERYLWEAVESVLGQSYKNFEFLIIDDGSTDRSAEIVQSYSDPRIRLVHNSNNQGIIATLNKGIELARGKYVARMDSDDISLPSRLKKQVAFLESHPEVGICGSWIRVFGDGRDEVWRLPTDHRKIVCSLLFNSVLPHPSVLMSLKILKMHSLNYNPLYVSAEDYAFWIKAAQYTTLANIDEVLLWYRLHPQQVGQQNIVEQQLSSRHLRLSQLKNLHIEPSDKELAIHQQICSRAFGSEGDCFNSVMHADEWLRILHQSNKLVRFYPEPAFSHVLTEQWLSVCKPTICHAKTAYKMFVSPFRRYYLMIFLVQLAYWRKDFVQRQVTPVFKGFAKAIARRWRALCNKFADVSTP